MTQHTDDDLGRLLAETFTSREQLASQTAAREIAAAAAGASVRRRRWPVYLSAAAAVCAVVAASTFALAGRSSQTTDANATGPTSSAGPTFPTGSRPAPTTYAANRAAAAAESARVLHLVPLPAGAVHLIAPPGEWPRGTNEYIAPSDPTLTKTSWWSVPVDSSTLQRYLQHHSVAGMQREAGVGGDGNGVSEVTYYEPSRRPASYIGVDLLVQWKQVGARTLVRAETFTAARAVRNLQSLVTGTVSAVDVWRVVAKWPGRSGGPRPPAHLTAAANSVVIAELVRAANHLPASMRPAPLLPCPSPAEPPLTLTVTFHTSEGTVQMRVQTACFGQIDVRRDGRLLTPTLDPGHFADLVNRLLHSGSGR